jgi:aminoglycoside 2''-phosphotransferase
MAELTSHLARIRAAFPDLSLSQVEQNREGLVHDIVIVNGERVFRFPKSEAARAELQREVLLLEQVRPCVDLTLPTYDYVADDMASYPLIPGKALLKEDLLALPAADRRRLLETLARFHHQMHSVPLTPAVSPSNAQGSNEDWRRLYERAVEFAYPVLMAASREAVDRHFAPLLNGSLDLDDYPPVLMNGDIGTYHILYDPDRQQINGIIDFGTAGVGDAATDIALFINNYGESLLREFATFYPGMARLIERARFIAGTLELQWLLGGLRSEDRSWFGVHIGRARDLLPVGSGWQD